MKQLHTFDEVFDSQKVFRCLLEAMANPGRRCSIQLQSEKLFGDAPEMLAVAVTLLDAGVSFCAPENPTLTEQILLLTHAKPVSPEEADYLFVTSVDQLPTVIQSAKEGTLENPHASATLIVGLTEGRDERTVRLSGPGVDGQLITPLPNALAQAVQLRDEQDYEYPQGIDYIFLLPESELLCIPRLVRMELYESLIKYGKVTISAEYPCLVEDRYIMNPSPIPKFDNYNGEEVEILAAKPVTGWTEAGTAGGHTIYSAQVGRDIFALYEGDEAAIMARREGYARSKGYDGSNKFTFDPNEVTFAADEKPSNLFVNYWPGAETYGADGAGYWINSVVRVLSIDGNVATIESPYHQVHTNSRYFFYNVKGELDEPGEFYYDFETGMVYYIPRGDIADVEIVAPTATRAFSLVGTADSKVHNITFDGLKIGKTNFTDQYLWPGSTGNYMTYETAGIEAVIYANHDYNLTIVNCAVNNAGVTGITFDDYSQGNTVLNTTITDSGFAGILMQAPAPTTISQYVNRNHTVMDCVIDTVGTRILHGGAIEIIQSGDNVITHNKLTNGPRMGIAIYGGFWESGGFQDTVIDGVEVTIDNVQDWMFARNNLFAYNDISRFMLDSEDGGVFYCQGGGRGNVVDHNLITDYGNETSGGIGIYLDDRADYFTITNNIVAQGNTSKTYAAYFKGHDNVIRNNLFLADSSRYPVVYFATFNNEPNHTLTFEKNILVQYGSSRKLIDFNDQWTADDQPARFASCDYNTYYLAGHEAGDEIFRVGSFYTFEEWKETFRVDAHSVLANPLLNEADYTVGEDSPALELGFVNIDIGEIGPRGSGGVQPEPDPDPNPDPDPDPENPDVPHTGVPAAVTAALAVCAAALTGLVLVRRKRRTFARPQ